MDRGYELAILDIVEDTVVDGPGFRTTVYASGCPHRCPGCHNPQSWDLSAGHVVSVEVVADKLLGNPFANITFSGGDPLMQVEAFTQLAKRIKAESGKNIWCYTGYCYEEICKSSRLSMILPYIDVLVDGRFKQELRDTGLLFRGSSNQRLVDIRRSAAAGRVCLFEYKPLPVMAV